MSVRTPDLSAFIHVLPAPHVVGAFIVEAYIEELGAPGGLGWDPPFFHLHPAMGAEGLIFFFSHFISLLVFLKHDRDAEGGLP